MAFMFSLNVNNTWHLIPWEQCTICTGNNNYRLLNLLNFEKLNSFSPPSNCFCTVECLSGESIWLHYFLVTYIWGSARGIWGGAIGIWGGASGI